MTRMPPATAYMAACAALFCATSAIAQVPPAEIIETRVPIAGQLKIEFDPAAAQAAGLSITALSQQFDILPSSLGISLTNGELRTMRRGVLRLAGEFESGKLAAKLIEVATTENPTHDDRLIVRDIDRGMDLFEVGGLSPDYQADSELFVIHDSVLSITAQLAAELGNPDAAGLPVGRLSIVAEMIASTIAKSRDGQLQSIEMLPGNNGDDGSDGDIALNPGPDIIVGTVISMAQYGSSGGASPSGIVGLALGTDSCNKGTESVHWYALPQVDHPVIPMNLYRLKNDRFEQVGQSWLKHAFTSLNDNDCGFGCQDPGTGSLIGPGCSDTYTAGLNSGQSGLGARAWVNPFTGAYPNTSRNHSGHSHSDSDPSHRIRVINSDLEPVTAGSATKYFGEGQYVAPWEYNEPNRAIHMNMFNNVSHRRFLVSGSNGSWSFSTSGSTLQEKPAISSWTGSLQSQITPNPGTDGMATLAWKVTDNGNGTWHYEYALYNMNYDRAFGSFSVPATCGVAITNPGFHAPPQEPGWANDNTGGSAAIGYSETPWTQTTAGGQVSWATETVAANPDANALRWGTLYNFRFDANRPPMSGSISLGIFKTGSPTSVSVTAQIPQPGAAVPQITLQPQSQTVCEDDDVTFSVTATSTSTLSYQWRKGGVDIGGATNDSYTITGVSASDAAAYDVIVSDACGSVTSSPATLTVDLKPGITTHPLSQSVADGGSVTFTVVGNGASPLAYQWRKGGVDIGGANSDSYTINPVAPGDAGVYDVVVSNACGSVDSDDAVLTVTSACAPCDANCDGSTNLFDIEPFIAQLGATPPPPCSPCAADTNSDGSINLFDIEGMVDCLTGP